LNSLDILSILAKIEGEASYFQINLETLLIGSVEQESKEKRRVLGRENKNWRRTVPGSKGNNQRWGMRKFMEFW